MMSELENIHIDLGNEYTFSIARVKGHFQEVALLHPDAGFIPVSEWWGAHDDDVIRYKDAIQLSTMLIVAYNYALDHDLSPYKVVDRD